MWRGKCFIDMRDTISAAMTEETAMLLEFHSSQPASQPKKKKKTHPLQANPTPGL
jgi:hypothetical protein